MLYILITTNILVFFAVIFFFWKQSSYQTTFRNQLNQEKEAFKNALLQQSFIHEAILTRESGNWCLKHNGDKKYFEPANLKKVVLASGEESTFSYEDDEVICQVSKEGKMVSEIVYTRLGGLKRGRYYDEAGTVVKEFEYDDIGRAHEKSTAEGNMN